jgi:hypothetical protein
MSNTTDTKTGISEAEWKATFEEMSRTDQAYIFGTFMGRALRASVDFPEFTGEISSQTAWKVRCEALTVENAPGVGLYPGALKVGEAKPLELVICAQHFLAELHGRFPESQVGVTLHHILRMLKEVRREVEKAADVQ